jgi:L-idonate 5-dehydrogenase
LSIAAEVGATRTVDLSRNADALDPYRERKGRIDVAFECSGAGAAVRTVCELVRPRGCIITVGLGPDVPLPLSLVVTKEIKLAGSFRFDAEFAVAADLIDRGQINVRPLLTGVFPFADAVAAFEAASDKTGAMKVQLQFQMT